MANKKKHGQNNFLKKNVEFDCNKYTNILKKTKIEKGVLFSFFVLHMRKNFGHFHFDLHLDIFDMTDIKMLGRHF